MSESTVHFRTIPDKTKMKNTLAASNSPTSVLFNYTQKTCYRFMQTNLLVKLFSFSYLGSCYLRFIEDYLGSSKALQLYANSFLDNDAPLFAASETRITRNRNQSSKRTTTS